MGSVIGDLLPLAIGVAVSPVPIIAAILMLLSPRAKATSVGFAGGWVTGIAVATVVFVLLGSTVGRSDGGPSAQASWIEIGLGLLLLALGVRRWRARNDHDTPRWMRAVDQMTAVKGFGLAFVLAAINPKNLLMCAAAGVTIGSVELSASRSAVAVAAFVVPASVSVVLPVAGYLVAAERLRGPLTELKEWLQVHNAAVMGTLVLVIGAVLIGKGIGGL